jgi:hypothetical protein
MIYIENNNRICECGEDMELIENCVDYYDPGNFYGHGQYEVLEWECPKCQKREEYHPD